MPADFQDIDGRRFYWDGQAYGSPEEAEEAAERLRADSFEARVIEGPDGPLVYNRREVSAT